MGGREQAEKIVRQVLLDAGCDFMAEDSVKFVEAELAALRAENAALKQRAERLAEESLLARKLLRGSVKKMPDGSFVELPQTAFWRGWYLEWDRATKATDSARWLEVKQ